VLLTRTYAADNDRKEAIVRIIVNEVGKTDQVVPCVRGSCKCEDPDAGAKTTHMCSSPITYVRVRNSDAQREREFMSEYMTEQQYVGKEPGRNSPRETNTVACSGLWGRGCPRED
jgi:hypothetical protein